MNMNKLLATLDGIEKGTVKGSAQKDAGAMKKILESFNAVQSEACGAMPDTMGSMPQRDGNPVSMNISLNASGKENVDELMSLLKSAGLDGAAMQRSMPAPAKSMPMALAMDSAEMEEEEFSNAPDEEYSDTAYMTKDLSGGINGQKKMYKPAAKGDNPMAVESIKERLWAALKEKKASENVPPMPVAKNTSTHGMRDAWMAKHGKTHNANGTPKAPGMMPSDDQSAAEIGRLSDVAGMNAAGKRVPPMPVAKNTSTSSMRDAWMSKYGKTHNANGTPKLAATNEAAKPDFLDMDKDGDRKEPMKKAVADKKKGSAPKKGVNPFAKKVKEGFPTVASAKARADKEKTTGKFDKKELKPGVTQYTRKASTYDDGGKDSDQKKADKKDKK